MQFEDRVVRAGLRYWGWHNMKQLLHEGYSTTSAIYRLFEGLCHLNEHRILIRDMPERAWRINALVCALPTDYQAALIGRYCLPPKETGQSFEDPEIAAAMGCSVRRFYDLLHSARAMLRRRVFDDGD